MHSVSNEFKTLTTIKADSTLVKEIRQIADSEGRKIQTVTNRLLKFAINQYSSIPHPNKPDNSAAD